MEFEVPRVWFGLTLTLLPDRTLVVNGYDYRGRRWLGRRGDPETPVRQLTVPDVNGLFLAHVSLALEAAVTSAVGGLPLNRTASTAPVAVPVFLEPPAGLEGLNWETVGPKLLPSVSPSRIEIVIHSKAKQRALPLRLPMHLLMVGDVAGDALDMLRTQTTPWFQPDSGLVALVWARSAAGARDLLRRTPFDVVVTDGWSAPELAAVTALHRLAVVVDPSTRLMATPAPAQLARSTLSIATPAYASVLAHLFEHLSHDLPLHQVVANLRMQHPELVARLTSTPDAVHDLRLMDVLAEVTRARRNLEARFGSDPSRPEIERVLTATQVVINFARETGGLSPLGRVGAQLGAARDAIAELPEATGTSAKRVFDIGLWRGTDVVAVGRDLYVTPHHSLQAGGHYHLDVHIGRRTRDSLVAGSQPPVDPLLPDSRRGHDLDVVVYPGNFELISPAIRPLHLPPAGASDIVTFNLVVPAQADQARLRISVLHHDNLLQTYRLTALVQEQEQRHTGLVTGVRLDHSATSTWANVDRFRPRYLSLVLNADLIDGTHQVFVKSSGTVTDFRLTEGFQKEAVAPLRATLTAAAKGGIDGKTAIRDLAQAGRLAWSKLWNVRGPARKRLRTLANMSDEILQITRSDANQSIPWSLLYDWPLPDTLNERTPVCWGHDAPEGLERCSHRSDSKALCVRGFWGVRHQVEERIGNPPGNLRDRIVMRGGHLTVDLAIGLKSMSNHVMNLRTDIGKIATLMEFNSGQSLLDRLWNPAERGAVVAILGHHNSTTRALDCGTQEKQLTPCKITNRAQKDGDWEVPAPLVMLLACESGVLSPENVTNHVEALNAVGASAVVATECVIFTSHAHRFAASLLQELVKPGATMGAAMQAARQRLLAGGDAVALAFLAFGSADVAVEP